MTTTAEVLVHFAGASGAGFAGIQRTRQVHAAVKSMEARPRGPLVIACLRTYHAEADTWAGLAAVHLWLGGSADAPESVLVLAKALRTGMYPEARERATEYYADCLLLADRWLGGSGDLDEQPTRDEEGHFIANGPSRIYVPGERSPVDRRFVERERDQ